MTKPRDGIIPDEEQRAYNAAGFGRATGLGRQAPASDRFRTTQSTPASLLNLIEPALKVRSPELRL